MVSYSYLTEKQQQKIEGYFNDLQQLSCPRQIEQTYFSLTDLWHQHPQTTLAQLMVQGVNYLQDESVAEAKSIFEQVVQEDQKYPEALHLLGACYFLEDEYKEALHYYKACLALEPRHPGALSGITSIYFILNEDRLALKWMRRLQQITPNNTELQDQITLATDMLNDSNPE